ncbi:MAG TPA: DUF2851 family protein, partial [bacterium]|nr:DUF2851 family protein [bacterium]
MKLTKKFLDYVFQNKLFINPLISDSGEIINILKLGRKNELEGPDYLNAKIEINGTKLKTDIELELNKNDWLRHNHHKNNKAGGYAYINA